MSLRPSILNPLFSEVTALEGVGPRNAQLLKKLLPSSGDVSLPRIVDLIWHMPTGVIDRRQQPKVIAVMPGQLVTLKVEVLHHKFPPRNNKKAPLRVICGDDTGEITLIFFRMGQTYIQEILPIGAICYISGRAEKYADIMQISHPDHIMFEEELDSFPFLEPVYPLTSGLSGKVLRKTIIKALDYMPQLPEWLDKTWLNKQGWPNFNQTLSLLHTPETEADLSTTSPARLRLAFDELLANQLALALVRENQKQTKGRSIVGTNIIVSKILEILPFSLTGSQQNALSEISYDMAQPSRMLRLLQGDVGSGKTIVALLVMVTAIEANGQAAMMAPTEVLARQHMETIIPLTDAVGLKVELLTGREKGRVRKDILGRVESGNTDILIGTHAIFQKDVIFRDLILAIVDEQHRFGVHQRMALQDKGKGTGADMLVMTATPIPRTLLLTHYGDMEVSKLTEKPAGRKPVATRIVPIERLEEIYSGLSRALETGTQVYWVCPLVESSQKIDLAAAEERFAHLQQRFGERVAMVHGQMKGKEKDAVMGRFSAGDLSILVATTVIEVGVNVPNASIMVIEHAERFGLAQLHQLRGRVGRGDNQSSCILLYQSPISETAKLRLETMRETEDGFVIAEKDLKLRGGGEILGTRQSGMPEFRVAQVPRFTEFLAVASDDAKLIIRNDPNLITERGQALRNLLYLFDCDEAIRLFLAG